MSRLVAELIRSRISAEAIDETAADNLVAIIRDALPADAGLDEIDHAVAMARDAYSPLLRRPAPQASAANEPLHVKIAREAGKQPAHRRGATERVAVALEHGNPWETGNLTMQALVAALDPAQAAQLQRTIQPS